MTTEYSISVDDWQDERWNHVGSDLMYDYYLKDRKTKRECKDCGCGDIETIAREKADDHYPMMLYAYPLSMEPSDEKIIEVCTKTNCTVVKDNETEDYFLALSGGGMDLSQDVALAYLIADGYIPTSLAINVCTQPCLSVGKKSYLKIMKAIKKQLKNEIYYHKEHIKKINETVKQFKESERARKVASMNPIEVKTQ